jgi:hypothetical protein
MRRNAEKELLDHLHGSDAAIKVAARDVRLNKRSHYNSVMQAHKNKIATLSNTVNNLKARTVSAELNLKRAHICPAKFNVS